MENTILNFDKTLEMGKRVYNSKMIENVKDGVIEYSDEEAIKALCSKIFTSNGEIKNMEDLRSFNKIIVEVAKAEAEADFMMIVNAVSDFKSVGRYDQVQYLSVPKKQRVKMAWSASATGVDFVKIPKSQSKVPAIQKLRQFGVQYQISEMVNNPVNGFRDAVNLVRDAQIKFIFAEIMKLARTGASAGKIPANQFVEVAGLTLANYRLVEGKLIRVGKNVKPVMIADNSFIQSLAQKQGSEGLAGSVSVLTDELKNSLLRDIFIEQVSKTTCIATDNPFVDDAHTVTELDAQEAIVLAGGEGSPFKITEFGGLRVAQDMPSIEKEQVLMKIDYVIDVTLFDGSGIAYIKDTAVIV